MRIETTQVIHGPAYRSDHRYEVVVMKLDIEALENLPTNLISGFDERLVFLMPSLMECHCPDGDSSGFLARVRVGTLIVNVVEHLAQELQCLAGMHWGYGRTLSTSRRGVYYVVFASGHEAAGIYAAHAAVRIAEELVAGATYVVADDVTTLRAMVRDAY